MGNNINPEIYALGKLAYTPEEVGKILGMPPDRVTVEMANPESEMFRSYNKGFYETDILLRQSVINLAKAGSSPAQNLLNQMLKQNHYKIGHD